MSIEKQCRAYSIPNIIDLPTIEQPIETELLIPEYCPDIIKILKCDVKNRVISKKIKEEMLELDCCAEITILYCGEDNVISSVITKYNYAKNLENKLFSHNNIDVCITSNNFNCRQTSARRIDVKGSINLNLSIHSFVVKEVLYDIKNEHIEQLKCNYDATSTVFVQEKTILVEDELLISSDKPDVNYILRRNAVAIINECKQIGEKAIIKGNIKVDILYCTVNNTPAVFNETIPFSQIIELNIKDKNCNIISKAEVSSFEAKPINAINSNAGFLINISLNIVLKGKCNVPVNLIKDCYSTRNKMDVVKDKIILNKLVETIHERVVVKKNLVLNDNQISSIVDLWCCEDKIDGLLENECLKISGVIESSILYCDMDNNPEQKNAKLEYELNKKITNSNLKIKNINQKIQTCSYTLISENQIEIQAEIYIFAEIYEECESDCVSDLIENNEALGIDDSIIIYYCDEEETVWNVAKRFSTPVSSLMEQNGLSDDLISSQSILVISRM